MKLQFQRIESAHILEALWISAILIVPIICVSQYFILSESATAHTEVPKVALLRIIAAAMLITYLYQLRNIQLRWLVSWTRKDVLYHVRHSHETLVFLAVLLVSFSTIITTALSSNMTVSLWGFIPGQSTDSTYNTICYLIIFTAIATNLKSQDQFRRLFLSIIAMGLITSSVGFFQHFGVNLFMLLPSPDTIDYSRAALTTGNAVAAGSLLLIPILITVAVSSAHLYTTSMNLGFGKAFILRIIIWSAILSIEFSALLFTLSRGPGIATAASILLLIICLIIFRKFRVVAMAIVIVAIAAILSISINSIPVDYQMPVPQPQLTERIADIKTQVRTGSLNQRTSIWGSSAELITYRPWFESIDLTLTSIRWFIGYGPGTFQYTFNLTSKPSLLNGHPLSAINAHNYFIHKTVTEGMLGLVSTIGLLGSPILMSGLLLISRKDKSTLQIICLSSIFAVFAGRLAEQLIGIASVSDLTVFWVCLAASVVAMKVLSNNTRSQNQSAGCNNEITEPRVNVSLQVFVLVLSGLAILIFTTVYAIKYPVSGVFAGQSRSLYEVGKFEQSLHRIETAISITPEVPYYYFFKNILLAEFIDRPEKAIHYYCNEQAHLTTDSKGYSLCLAQEMYSTAHTNKNIQPFWYHSAYQLAAIAKSFGQEREALLAYEHLAELLPTNRTTLLWLSQEYIARGMFSKALDTLHQSLKISASNPESGNNEVFIEAAIKLLNETD